MNTYHFTFPFRGEYIFITMDANILANQLVNMMGDYGFTFEEGQYYQKTFTSKNPETNAYEELQVNFNFKDPAYVDVFYPDNPDDELCGQIIERNIPCLLLKVTDNDGKELYDVND
jgi:hypothetical protein